MSTTNPTHKTGTIDAQPDDDLDDRSIKALLTPMTVIDDCGDVAGAEGLFEVTTASGSEYIVDLVEETCTCPDHEYRGVRCKHIRRCEFETGRRAIPGWVNIETLDDQLGEHITEGEPRIAMTDGGVRSIAAAREERAAVGRFDVEHVDGGALVFDESCEKPGKRLVGFADVSDWDAIRSELTRRGHGVGAIHHLEVFDLEEVQG